MADVALAPGILVGDDGEGVRLGSGPGGRRHGDERPPRRQSRPVVLELPDREVVDGAQVERLRGIHRRAATDRHDDRAVQPEVVQHRGSSLNGRGAWVRLAVAEDAGLEPAGSEDIEDAIDDARATNARVGHDEGS